MAFQAAMASSVNHTVRLPRCRSASLYAAQFVTRRFGRAICGGVVFVRHEGEIRSIETDRLLRHPAHLCNTLAPAVPLALVVLFWARDRTLGWIACLVVVATALLPYVRNVVVERLYDAGDMGAVDTWAKWSGWVLVVLLPIGAALGWGIARRRGTSWWPGVLVGGAVAALFDLFDLGWFANDPGLQAMSLAFVYHVVPVVLGCLACWWLEVRQRA